VPRSILFALEFQRTHEPSGTRELVKREQP
jgi:hypothetical protein